MARACGSTASPAAVRKIRRVVRFMSWHADGFFEVGDGATDGDLGHTVSAGGGGKAIELDDSRENGELGGGPQFTHRRTKGSNGARIVSLKYLIRKAP